MMRSCAVESCDRSYYGRGYCEMHYRRVRKHGDPMVVATSTPPHPAGKDHPLWSGDAVGYVGAHQRVRKTRGHAASHRCVDCGNRADTWSYRHDQLGLFFDEGKQAWYSPNPQDYDPRCHSCHVKFDRREKSVGLS